jgi:hypothetical protein
MPDAAINKFGFTLRKMEARLREVEARLGIDAGRSPLLDREHRDSAKPTRDHEEKIDDRRPK